jgi:ABC-2 type transport system ATP-binding protein
MATSATASAELRQDMWNVVRGLKESGVTIILTTHYIKEAEEIAERVGVINRGEIILVGFPPCVVCLLMARFAHPCR